MPKTFTEKEKKLIKNILIQEGRELFSKYGLRKTSITELTKAAGIAQGTFYNFFDSKEELYFEIIELEQFKSEQFLENIVKSSHSSKESLRKIIKGIFELFEINPIIHRLYESRDYELMVRKLPPEKLENHNKDDAVRVLNFIMDMQQGNELIDARPEVIAGLLRAITMLYFHQDEIGRDIYPEVINLLAEIVADGLVKEI
ncbi:TetR/AcrR family transcriptional regulator [Methanobacterium sp.]|uniref:TetR/AcrR family transcriptional regulator n=1 Tax=Methanobacterium sp. TaxID=2164 RepID=UPI003C77E27B